MRVPKCGWRVHATQFVAKALRLLLNPLLSSDWVVWHHDNTRDKWYISEWICISHKNENWCFQIYHIIFERERERQTDKVIMNVTNPLLNLTSNFRGRLKGLSNLDKVKIDLYFLEAFVYRLWYMFQFCWQTTCRCLLMPHDSLEAFVCRQFVCLVLSPLCSSGVNSTTF